MRATAMLIATAMILAAPAPVQASEPGPAGPCINAVFEAMTGAWGVDDDTFDDHYIPLTAWNVIPSRQHPGVVAMLTNGEANVWFLTEHGVDFTHDLRNGSYEGVSIATELLSCQEGGADEPAIIESMISFGPRGTRLRERIELTADRLSIQHFDRRDALVSEQRMRRYAVLAIDPPPAPPPSR